MKRRRWLLRVPFAIGWLGLPASCIVFEPLGDLANERSSGGQWSSDGGAEGDGVAAGQGAQSGGNSAEDGGGTDGSEVGESGASSDGSGGTSNATKGGVGGMSGGMANTSGGSNSMGGANACVHTCGGRFSEDFEGCSYPRETVEPKRKTTLGCPREGEDAAPEIIFVCQAGNEESCAIDWDIRESETDATRHVVCFWGNDPNMGNTPAILFHVRADDFTGAQGVTYRYCSNEALWTIVSCGEPTTRCSEVGTGAPATVEGDDKDAAECANWRTASVPFESSFSAADRASANLVVLQTKIGEGLSRIDNFKVCIDELSLYY